MKRDKRIPTLICMALIMVLIFGTVTAYAGPAKNGITTIDELNGRQLGVQTAVCYEDAIKDRIPDAVWNYYQMPNDMIMALETNKIDAYLIEEVGFVAQLYEHPELIRLEEAAGTIDFVIAVGNNEKQDTLVPQINEFVSKMNADGRLQEMYDYWITNWNPNTCVLQFHPDLTGENGTINVAVEGAYEPFSFFGDGGQLSGFDIEYVLRFCEEYGYIPNFYSVPFDSISAGTEQGKYDFGMNIVLTDERSEGAELSDVYYTCDIVFVLEGETEEDAGFFEKIGNSFYKTFIKEARWKMFAEGTGVTVLITISSIVMGTLLGFLMYMMCRKGNKLANGFMSFFTWLVQGLPTVVLMMILFYVVFGSTRLNGSLIAVVGFSLIFACSMFDMLHVGLGAVGKSQLEAARAMGYSERLSFFKILLPQAAHHFLPIYRNEVVTLIKETSIVGYIAVLDLTKICDLVRSRTYEAFFALIATAVIYLVVETLMIAVVKFIEAKVNPKRRSKEKILRGIKEWE